MRRRIFLVVLASAFACGGCSLLWPKPDAADVDRLEQALAGRPCIGALGRWERHYRYATHRTWPRNADRDLIHFVFYQAGIGQFVAGRRIEGELDDMLLYDGDAQVAMGRYAVRTGAVTIEHCGSNWPSENQPPPR